MTTGDGSAAEVCGNCGCAAPASSGQRVVDGWSIQLERGRATLVCPVCTRAHSRDIEAKLDREFWA